MCSSLDTIQTKGHNREERMRFQCGSGSLYTRLDTNCRISIIRKQRSKTKACCMHGPSLLIASCWCLTNESMDYERLFHYSRLLFKLRAFSLVLAWYGYYSCFNRQKYAYFQTNRKLHGWNVVAHAYPPRYALLYTVDLHDSREKLEVSCSSVSTVHTGTSRNWTNQDSLEVQSSQDA